MTGDHNPPPAAAEAKPGERCRRCGQIGSHEQLDDDCVLHHRKPHVHADHGLLCEPCVDRHKEWVREISDLYATLDQVVLAGSIADETADHMHTKKAAASPSPLRLDAWALLHPEQLNDQITAGPRLPDGTYELVDAKLGANLPDVAAVLARWASATYGALGWTAAAPIWVKGAAAVLETHAETVATLADVATYDTELRWVRRALRSAQGLTDPKPLGRCLTVNNGRECSGNVWPDRYGGQPCCSRCRRRYSDRDLVKLQITEEMTA